MKIRINPTRMQLLILRRRLSFAVRGHKLLKDKLDGLMQKFFHLKDEYQALYQDFEPKLTEIFKKSVLGTSLSHPGILELPLKDPKTNASVEISFKNIMGVKTEEYTLKDSGKQTEFSPLLSSVELREAQLAFIKFLPKLLSLAAYSRSLQLMALQIIETRRRVNALEYVLIPELERTVADIKMKLSEMERAGQVTLLKIKDIVRTH